MTLHLGEFATDARVPPADDGGPVVGPVRATEGGLTDRTGRHELVRGVKPERSPREKGTSVHAKTDWMTVASRAVEMLPKPAVVLDRRGVICLFNEAMQRLVGRTRDESVDASWFDLCVPPEAQESTRVCFEQVAKGALSECECKVVTKSGARLRTRLEVSLVGAGPQAALLAVVADSEREESEHDTPLDGTQYEISTAPHEWGQLRSVRAAEGSVPGARGQPCFAWFQKRMSPCPGCPALSLHETGTHTAVIPSGDGALPIRWIGARMLKGGGASVTARTLEPAIVQEIVDAKLVIVAKERHLSPRERDVLRSLLHGDSSQDIAGALGISPRTVKFHQANLLRKLGAESRLELVRWIL